jgi:hypothetical protein
MSRTAWMVISRSSHCDIDLRPHGINSGNVLESH